MNLKKQAKEIYDFVWKGDSWTSWIVSLLIAFIIVKFIFFPLMSLTFGTSMPLVVVESSSMYHPGGIVKTVTGLNLLPSDSFTTWWEQNKEWYLENRISSTKTWNLKNGLDIGDIVLVYGRGKVEEGDIIIFEAGTRHPIIHRIVSVEEKDGKIFYATKGDNNQGQLINERAIPKDAIIGKAILRIPKLGWVKLGFVKLFELFI